MCSVENFRKSSKKSTIHRPHMRFMVPVVAIRMDRYVYNLIKTKWDVFNV